MHPSASVGAKAIPTNPAPSEKMPSVSSTASERRTERAKMTLASTAPAPHAVTSRPYPRSPACSVSLA